MMSRDAYASGARGLTYLPWVSLVVQVQGIMNAGPFVSMMAATSACRIRLVVIRVYVLVS